MTMIYVYCGLALLALALKRLFRPRMRVEERCGRWLVHTTSIFSVREYVRLTPENWVDREINLWNDWRCTASGEKLGAFASRRACSLVAVTKATQHMTEQLS
jgi:hypothetical protein